MRNGSLQPFWVCSVKGLNFKLRACITILYLLFLFPFLLKEMSHRTSDFSKILNTAENLLRELL